MVEKTKGFVSGIFLELGQGSPETWLRLCDATAVSGIGKTNSEEDGTTFCDNGNRTFIPGVSEGSTLTIDMNYVISSETRRALVAAVDQRLTVPMRLVVDPDDQGDPDEIYYFDVAMLGWSVAPNATAKNTAQVTGRISGPITYEDNYEAP